MEDKHHLEWFASLSYLLLSYLVTDIRPLLGAARLYLLRGWRRLQLIVGLCCSRVSDGGDCLTAVNDEASSPEISSVFSSYSSFLISSAIVCHDLFINTGNSLLWSLILGDVRSSTYLLAINVFNYLVDAVRERRVAL